MVTSKKIKLQVSDQDAATLEFMQGKCRALYNWHIMKLRAGEAWPGWRKAKKTLQQSKGYDPELSQVYGKLLHEVYFRIDRAMQAFFRRVKAGETAGFPRVRPRHSFFTLCYPACYLTIKGMILMLPTGGKGTHKQYANIQARLTELPPDHFQEVAISRDGSGNYFASFPTETAEEEQREGDVVAFDLGIKTLATGVTPQGRVYHIGGFKGVQWYNKQLDKIRSKRSKCQKKSRRYLFLSQTYQRISQKKRNKQRDSLHKASHLITHNLVERTIVVGNLSQRQMVMKQRQERNKKLNRMVFNDWGVYLFIHMLRYKSQLYGKQVQIEDEHDTSKMCSGCQKLQPMPLWKRTYRCRNCALVMDRDENSAINILTRFLARREPHASTVMCGVLQENSNSVEVVEASCPTILQQLNMF